MNEHGSIIKDLVAVRHLLVAMEAASVGKTSLIENIEAINSAITALKALEPRVMNAAEVANCPNGTVLWVEERQGVTWNLFPLEIETRSTHPDTGTDYLFFITYHDIRKFECNEYNLTWRCWTSRPTDEQREAEPWV